MVWSFDAEKTNVVKNKTSKDYVQQERNRPMATQELLKTFVNEVKTLGRRCRL